VASAPVGNFSSEYELLMTLVDDRERVFVKEDLRRDVRPAAPG
jgi:hypothetical protein